MREGRGRRIHPISWYIGSGNISSVFTRRAKSPFVKVKEIYGTELERYLHTQNIPAQVPKKLTEKERFAIRERVIAAVAKERRTNIIIGIIIFIIIAVALYLIKNLAFPLFENL